MRLNKKEQTALRKFKMADQECNHLYDCEQRQL